MANILNFGDKPKRHFRVVTPAHKADSVQVIRTPLTAGQALYNVYREERGKQNFEELTWEHLMIAARLVWERLAEHLGVKLSEK